MSFPLFLLNGKSNLPKANGSIKFQVYNFKSDFLWQPNLHNDFDQMPHLLTFVTHEKIHP